MIRNPPLDLGSAYLIVNNNKTQRVKLNGVSKRLNENTFQLPEHIFIEPATYQCLIDAKKIYNESVYSESSSFIPMPGIIFCFSVRLFNMK